MSTAFIGIDPGKGGGIAWIRDGKACAEKMPDNEKDILDLLNDILRDGPAIAALESVHAMPGQGVTSCFTFGSGFGGLKMALAACDIPYFLVTPQKWQKMGDCMTKGDKNVTKDKAARLFPTIKVTHAVADALLLADHCTKNASLYQ